MHLDLLLVIVRPELLLHHWLRCTEVLHVLHRAVNDDKVTLSDHREVFGWADLRKDLVVLVLITQNI